MSGSNSISNDLGFASCMGPELREFVERQLLDDLNHYVRSKRKIRDKVVHFDWSGSCVEGHRTSWLDGEIENFSGIGVYDLDHNLIAEGWMEFIETQGGLEVFWWFLRGGERHDIQEKTSNGIPEHIWERLSPEVRLTWKSSAPGKQKFP
ncbi:MAG: hypothetical protein AAGE61_01775 [Pseudomonadota bacterium]